MFEPRNPPVEGPNDRRTRDGANTAPTSIFHRTQSAVDIAPPAVDARLTDPAGEWLFGRERESVMRRLGVLLSLLCFTLASAHAADPSAPAASPRLVVFFQEWSAALDDAALAVISKAADAAKAQKASLVRVNGFADPTGSRRANELLSELRMQVVIDQLQTDGVTPSHILGRGHGSVQFALTSQESRRVEISVGGP